MEKQGFLAPVFSPWLLTPNFIMANLRQESVLTMQRKNSSAYNQRIPYDGFACMSSFTLVQNSSNTVITEYSRNSWD